jgi:hypothetical protein
MKLKFVCFFLCLFLFLACVNEEVIELDSDLINGVADDDLIDSGVGDDLNKSSFELIEFAFSSGELNEENYFIQTIYSVYEPDLMDEKFKGTDFVVDESFMNYFLIKLDLVFDSFSPEAQEILLPFILSPTIPESYWYSKYENYDEIVIEVQKKENELILFSENNETVELNETDSDVIERSGVRFLFPKNYSEEKRKIIIDSVKKAHQKYYGELNFNRLKGEIIISIENFPENEDAAGTTWPSRNAGYSDSDNQDISLLNRVEKALLHSDCFVRVNIENQNEVIPRVIIHELFHCAQFAQPIYMLFYSTDKIHPFIVEPCAYYSEELILGTKNHYILNEFNLVKREKDLCEKQAFHFSEENLKKIYTKVPEMPSRFIISKDGIQKTNWINHINKFRVFFPITLNDLREIHPWPKEIILNISDENPFFQKRIILVRPENKKTILEDNSLQSKIPEINWTPILGIVLETNYLDSLHEEPFALDIYFDYYEFFLNESVPNVIKRELIFDYGRFLEQKPKINLEINFLEPKKFDLNKPGLILFGFTRNADELLLLIEKIFSNEKWKIINFNEIFDSDYIAVKSQTERAKTVHNMISENYFKELNQLLIIGDSVYFPYREPVNLLNSQHTENLESLFNSKSINLDEVYYSDINLDGEIDLTVLREPMNYFGTDFLKAKEFLEKKYLIESSSVDEKNEFNDELNTLDKTQEIKDKFGITD